MKLDKFYTKPEWASHCVDVIYSLISWEQRQLMIEPAAGEGAFLDAIDITRSPRVVGVDIAPDRMDIHRANFLEWSYPTTPDATTIFGNPPFGFAANNAVRFFNKAATMANVIAFIVPLSFRKLSVQAKLHKNFHLIYDEPCPQNCFTVLGNEHDVPTCFQIWVKTNDIRKTDTPANPGFVWLSKEEAVRTSGALAIQRVGSRAGEVKSGDLHKCSQSTHYFFMASDDLCDILVEANLTESPVVNNTTGAKSLSKSEIYEALQHASTPPHCGRFCPNVRGCD